MYVRCPPNTLGNFSKCLYGTKDVMLIRGRLEGLSKETIPVTSSCKTCMCGIMWGVVETHIGTCIILYNGACSMSSGLKGLWHYFCTACIKDPFGWSPKFLGLAKKNTHTHPILQGLLHFYNLQLTVPLQV
jgi:hypothetical protein